MCNKFKVSNKRNKNYLRCPVILWFPAWKDGCVMWECVKSCNCKICENWQPCRKCYLHRFVYSSFKLRCPTFKTMTNICTTRFYRKAVVCFAFFGLLVVSSSLHSFTQLFYNWTLWGWCVETLDTHLLRELPTHRPLMNISAITTYWTASSWKFSNKLPLKPLMEV